MRPRRGPGPTLAELAWQCLHDIEGGYDLLAPRFDHTPFRTPAPLAEALLDAAFASGPVTDALDLCCGTGALLVPMASRVRGRLVGVDLSQGMLDIARARLDPARPAELVRGDARALPFDAAFDLIVSAGAFGHFLPSELPRLLEGVARALRPGGRFVCLAATAPRVPSRAWAFERGFDMAMRARNALLRPPFVMYYGTFRWPTPAPLLRAAGLCPTAVPLGRIDPTGRLVVVTARRPSP